MFGKTICPPKCQVTSSRCEDLILLHFYLHVLTHECKMEISTDKGNQKLRKNVGNNKNYI